MTDRTAPHAREAIKESVARSVGVVVALRRDHGAVLSGGLETAVGRKGQPGGRLAKRPVAAVVDREVGV